MPQGQNASFIFKQLVHAFVPEKGRARGAYLGEVSPASKVEPQTPPRAAFCETAPLALASSSAQKYTV